MEDILEECDLSDEDAALMVYNSNGQLQYKVVDNFFLNFTNYIYIVLGWFGRSTSFV